MGQWGPLSQRVSAGIRQLSQQAPPGFRGPSGGSNSMNPKPNDANSCPGSGATRRCSPHRTLAHLLSFRVRRDFDPRLQDRWGDRTFIQTASPSQGLPQKASRLVSAGLAE